MKSDFRSLNVLLQKVPEKDVGTVFLQSESYYTKQTLGGKALNELEGLANAKHRLEDWKRPVGHVFHSDREPASCVNISHAYTRHRITE